MAKHTSGPWELEHVPECRRDMAPEHYRIAARIIAGAGFGVIADTLNRDHNIDPEEDAANARLLFVAPALLRIARWHHADLSARQAAGCVLTREQNEQLLFAANTIAAVEGK